MVTRGGKKGNARLHGLTCERILELLEYDREHGRFFHRIPRKGCRVGEQAGGTPDDRGYRYLRIDQRDYLVQRIVWFLETGEWPEGILRFRDGDPSNCAFSNLRDASYVEEGKHDWRTKEGKAAQQKAYRTTIPGQLRDYAYRTKFGISVEEYEAMLEAQGGVCAICGRPETARRGGKTRLLAVDHDHKTGKIRGLLCTRCNPMIGYADDDEEVLRQAIDYLRRHRKE